MPRLWHKASGIALLAVLALAGCSDSSTDPEVVDGSVTVGGLKFSLNGATLTVVSGALPTPDPNFANPTLNVDRTPTATQAATLAVSSAEQFQTVLVQPNGSTQYVRIFLPASAGLIGVTVLSNPGSSSSVATAVTVSVANVSRVSRTSSISFVPVSN